MTFGISLSLADKTVQVLTRLIISVSLQSRLTPSWLYDGSDQRAAEEIHNAPTVIPLSMGVSTLLNGILGFAMLLALLFCMPSDINSVLGSNTYYPFINIYAYAVGSNSGATAMVSRIIDLMEDAESINILVHQRRDAMSI